MAPNGLFLNYEELALLSQGIKLENNDTFYFRPSFVIDPWVGLRVMKTTCLVRYWYVVSPTGRWLKLLANEFGNRYRHQNS